MFLSTTPPPLILIWDGNDHDDFCLGTCEGQLYTGEFLTRFLLHLSRGRVHHEIESVNQ